MPATRRGKKRASEAPAVPEPVAAEDEARVLDTVLQVKETEERVRASRSNVNLLASLLATLRSAADPEAAHTAGWALLRLFRDAMQRGDLHPNLRLDSLGDKDDEDDDDGHDDAGDAAASSERASKRARTSSDAAEPEATVSQALRMYRAFLRQQYLAWLDLLCEHIGGDVASLQLSALHILMRMVVIESEKQCSMDNKVPELRSSVYARLVRTMITSGNLSDALLSRFLDRFVLLYADVQQHLWVQLRRLCLSSRMPSHDNARRLVLLLLKRSAPSLVSMLTDRLVGGDEDEDAAAAARTGDDDAGAAGGARRRKKKRSRGESAATIAKRRAYADAWLAFLRLRLPRDVYKDVLSQLHTLVLPYLPRPAALTDFLTDSFNVGGVVSLLALNGVFILISRHNLNYPDFYPKLYSLLTPNVMHSRYRPRFLELLSLFLTSSYLPSYMVAAFAKRVSRLALTAPPAATIALVPLVYNLLLRHPHCMYLIHRQSSVAASPLDFSSPAASSATDTPDELQSIDGKPDAFDMTADAPGDSGVALTSLWELHSLYQYALPATSRLAHVLEAPMRKQSYSIKEFLSHTYASLFESEVYRRTEESPLEYRRPSNGLFDPAAFPAFDVSDLVPAAADADAE